MFSIDVAITRYGKAKLHVIVDGVAEVLGVQGKFLMSVSFHPPTELLFSVRNDAMETSKLSLDDEYSAKYSTPSIIVDHHDLPYILWFSKLPLPPVVHSIRDRPYRNRHDRPSSIGPLLA